jgi:hypothetical protein
MNKININALNCTVLEGSDKKENIVSKHKYKIKFL